tara:strand:- start:40 stop:264 length:225 start_codon:yes stop_codon:yes gene_type:complete
MNNKKEFNDIEKKINKSLNNIDNRLTNINNNLVVIKSKLCDKEKERINLLIKKRYFHIFKNLYTNHNNIKNNQS